MILAELFWSFFQIGLFSFGGGNAAMPFIQAQVVDLHHWLTLTEFADLVTLAEMTPGPIAVNAATFVGTRLLGLPGALTATLGCILPCCIIALTLSVCYKKLRDHPLFQGVLQGLRPAVVALIASAGLSIALLALLGADNAGFDWIAAVLFAAALFILRRFRPNPIWVMIGCGLVGMILYLIL